MPTRRTFQNPECFLECGTLEDSIDKLEYSPFFNSLLSRLPTHQTGRVLLCLQPDFSPPFLLYVVDAFKRIKLEDIDGRNQFLTRQFYFWLRDVFIPFLQRVEGVIPDIFVQVDAFFKAVGLPVISQIIKKLRNQFSEVPLCIIRSIFLRKWRRNGCLHLMSQSSTARIVCGFTLAKLQMKYVHVQSLPSIREKAIREKDALSLISKLEHFKCVEGKLLRRRLLALTVAQNLIKRLSGSHRHMFFLLMRVLVARSFA
jgi:hypothetical protein